MMSELGISQRLKVRVKFNYNLKIANCISLNPAEYSRLKEDVEMHPLFKRLCGLTDNNERVIKRRRFPCTDVLNGSLELNERVLTGDSSSSVEVFLSEQKEVVRIIKKIGIDRFKKYFLYNESNIPAEEVAGKCRLRLPEVEKINGFINEFLLKTEFALKGEVPFYADCDVIAAIEEDGSSDGEFVINYLSLSSARGEYLVNHEKLIMLKKKNIFSKQELKEINDLLQKIKLINSRETIIYRILKEIISIQKEYLNTNDTRKLVSCSQKELSQKIAGDPSTVNRAVKNRSIITPWGGVKPLKDFLPSRKHVRKRLIEEIISSNRKVLSDEEIADILVKKIEVSISRRSVADYRKELKIPSSFKRKSCSAEYKVDARRKELMLFIDSGKT